MGPEPGSNSVWWNVHRCYGQKRWPMVTANWEQVAAERFGDSFMADTIYTFQKPHDIIA